MKGSIYTAIKYRKITLFVLVVSILVGAYNYYVSPRQENPDITAPIAMVSVIYPGASPEDVESLVTSKVEEEISEIEGFDYSNSYSRNSISVSILRMKHGTNMDEAWTSLRRSMEDLQDELPDECQTIDVDTDLVETAGIIVSVSGENYSYEELYDYTLELKEDLSKIEGISRFDIEGKQEKNVKVKVNYKLLNQFDLSLAEISDLIKGQNVEIPSGSIDTGSEKINVKAKGTFSDIEEIKNIIIGVSPENGAVTRLSDIADVELALEEASYKIKEGHNKAVLLTGYFLKNKNIVLVGKDVEGVLEKFEKELPKDLHFEQVLYQPQTVDKSVHDFAMNLLQGVGFVIVVVFIGMGLRNAVIVSTAIPASIFITFIFMGILDVNIHQISISALIVALGMLVDNGIVISDAIQVLIDDGEDKMKACVDGTKSVAIPVLTSTLTTIAAFMPFLFLDSIAGEYLSSLPKIIMIALMASYVIALFVTPSMAYIFFRKSSKRARPIRIADFFERALDTGLRHKWVVVVFVALALLSTAYIGQMIPLQFFPKADTNMMYINIVSHGSGDIEQTESIVDQVGQILEKEEAIRAYTSSIGGDLPKFFNTISKRAPSNDYAQMMIRLDLSVFGPGKTYESIEKYVLALQDVMDSKVSAGRVTVNQLEQAEPIGAPVRLRLTGKNMDDLGAVSEDIKGLLSEISGTQNIHDDFEQRVYEFEVVSDRTKTSHFGVSNFDLQNEVSLALRGRESSTFRKFGVEYPIIVSGNIESKTDLENFMIKSRATGHKVLLKEIADVELRSQLPVIKKYNNKLAVHVLSDVKPNYSSGLIQTELKTMLRQKEYEGIEIEFDGEPEKIGENFGNIVTAAIYAVLAVYLILLIQFKSFIQPLIILITVPLAVIGSIFGLYVFDQALSFTAMLGMVSLLGIVVNNAIVLVDFINYELNEGKCIEEACEDAVQKRMRPIILSTSTTVIGLTPLVYSGSPLFMPLAVALMSGLIVSTVLTLVVIPVIYSLVMRFIHTC
ncbi:efflux RND transporter permease subunit [Fusibacter sp. JL216-2]|uniref:efflux RND transporter permease subunit n=1 Tax=Fusibacter sp. JL216-2 TaxID=3071453 RepID=UPI003D34520E